MTKAKLLLVVLSTAQGVSVAGAGVSQRAEEVFRDTNVSVIQIEIPANEIVKLRGRGWGWGFRGGSRERPEVRAVVKEGGQVYTNVALHLKGAAGSYQPVEAKPALTLNFDKYAKGQTFHGLTKMSLNNSVQDPSYLSEKLCRELFVAAGVPAPRAGFATVTLNGRRLGFYVLLEGYNRRFLKRFFNDTKGNLYDGGFLKDVDSRLGVNSGDEPDNQSDLRALVSAAREPDLAKRFARLRELLDIDRFVSFLAMEVLVCHWDGYAMNKNNYRVYHDRDVDRILFMPHGMDQMFGVMMAESTMRVRPPMQGLVARALMETTEGRKRYFTRLAELNGSVFRAEELAGRARELAAVIQPVLEEMSAGAAAGHEEAVKNLCERILLRKQSLDEQLASGPGQSLPFDQEGTANLTSWICTTNYGAPVFTERAVVDGRSVLRIKAANGGSIGSWRTKVLLEDGHYAFQGQMRTSGVSADPLDQRAGAGLRVLGKPAASKTLGSSKWTEVICEFDVPDGFHDVELVCELRAAEGEAVFDLNSLRLIRK